jgi:hypothetical protein
LPIGLRFLTGRTLDLGTNFSSTSADALPWSIAKKAPKTTSGNAVFTVFLLKKPTLQIVRATEAKLQRVARRVTSAFISLVPVERYHLDAQAAEPGRRDGR